MLRLFRVFRDPGEGGSGDDNSITALVSEVKNLQTTVKEKVEKIEVAQSDYRSDLNSLKSSIDDLKKNGTPLASDQIEKALEDVLEKQEADRLKERRSLLPNDAQKYVVPDVWKNASASGSSLADMIESEVVDVKSTLDEGRRGFDRIMQMTPFDANHKAMLRLATEVKIADEIGRLTTRPGQEYKFIERYPKLSKFWGRNVNNFMRSYDVKTDPMDLTAQSEWVPTGWTSELRELIQIMLVVAGLFERIPMPQSPYTLPVDLTDVLGSFVSQTTGVTNPWDDSTMQALDTQNMTFTAKKLRARMMTSGELLEDSIVPLLPLIRRRLVNAQAQSVETAIVNGDATTTHMDADTEAGAATLPQKMWDGLREYCVTASKTTDASNAAPTTTLLNTVRKNMGEFAIETADLAYLFTMSGFVQLLNDTTVKTVDVLGPNATLLNGQLASIWGSPILVSRHMRHDLNASGVEDGSTTDRGCAIAVNRNAWLLGDRRRVTLESERLINTDQWNIVTFQRLDFQEVFVGAAAAQSHTWMLMNIAA